HALEPIRRALPRGALERARQDREAEAERALRDRARRAWVHVEPSARGDRIRRSADRLRGRRRAARTGPRLAASPDGAVALLLEEREVAARPGAASERPARLLGALRVPQRGRLLEGGEVRLLAVPSSEGMEDSRRRR